MHSHSNRRRLTRPGPLRRWNRSLSENVPRCRLLFLLLSLIPGGPAYEGLIQEGSDYSETGGRRPVTWRQESSLQRSSGKSWVVRDEVPDLMEITLGTVRSCTWAPWVGGRRPLKGRLTSRADSRRPPLRRGLHRACQWVTTEAAPNSLSWGFAGRSRW